MANKCVPKQQRIQQLDPSQPNPAQDSVRGGDELSYTRGNCRSIVRYMLAKANRKSASRADEEHGSRVDHVLQRRRPLNWDTAQVIVDFISKTGSLKSKCLL